MGGYGSGRPSQKFDYTVEDCKVIDIYNVIRPGFAKPGSGSFGTICWSINEQPTGSIGYSYQLDTLSPHLRLMYTWNKTVTVDYQLPLTHTKPYFGGIRWWFVCPGSGCGQRVKKLYAAPSSRFFLCRTCQNLTYTSCRQSHLYDRFFSDLAAKFGISAKRLKKIF